MMNRLDPGRVTTFPGSRSILYGGAGAPRAFHQVSPWRFELRTLQLLPLTLPPLLPPTCTLMTRIIFVPLT